MRSRQPAPGNSAVDSRKLQREQGQTTPLKDARRPCFLEAVRERREPVPDELVRGNRGSPNRARVASCGRRSRTGAPDRRQGHLDRGRLRDLYTLAAAAARGTVGVNLDVAKPSKAHVVSAVTDGSGVMVPFKGTLSADQIQAVAEYVSQNAGK